jgi:hypothetical protein
MITKEVMYSYAFGDPGTAPPHKLRLKLNDICILTRAVSEADKFATNTRVRTTLNEVNPPAAIRVQDQASFW